MDFKFDKDYPPEYAYLEDFIGKANIQLQKMDKVIYHLSDSMKPVQDPAKDVSPPWLRSKEDTQKLYRRERVITYLEDKRAAYRREILNIVTKEMAGADPKIALWVRQSCSFALSGFEEKTRRHDSQHIDMPTEKMYKLFSELPPTHQTEINETQTLRYEDAITEQLEKEEDVQRMMHEAQRYRQATKRQRGRQRRKLSARVISSIIQL